MKRALAALMCILANDASARPSVTFDLTCTSRSGQPITFRFDLHQKKWCAGACTSVGYIDEVSDARIRMSLRSPDHSQDWDIAINRYTATFAAIHNGWGLNPSDEGHCAAGPFTGFPTQKF